MTYLTIRAGEAQQARRVEPMRFAELFAEPAPPPPDPLPVKRSRLVPAALLLIALIGDLALMGRSTTLGDRPVVARAVSSS